MCASYLKWAEKSQGWASQPSRLCLISKLQIASKQYYIYAAGNATKQIILQICYGGSATKQYYICAAGQHPQKVYRNFRVYLQIYDGVHL